MNKNIYIRVEGDVNDGDYISRSTSVEGLPKKKIKYILNELNNYEPEVTPVDEEIQDYIPSLDNEELHTITEVSLIRIEKVRISKLEG
jgi:hypothetical protein